VRGMRRLVSVGWLGVTVVALACLFSANQSAADIYGYPPDLWLTRCLDQQGLTPYTRIFPDYASAEAAATADCQQKTIDGGWWLEQTCFTPPPGTPSPCVTSEFPCAPHFCYVEAIGCHPYFNSAFQNYLFPQPACSDTGAPSPQQDPNQEDPEQEIGGFGSGSTAGADGNSCDDFVCNPVKVATGNKYEKVIDLSITAPGIPLEFVRHYNSQAGSDGPLGYGWTHSFSVNLQITRATPTMRVKIKDADGRALYFSQLYYSNTGEVNFYGESGVKDRLKKINSTGQFVLKRKNNLTYLFDPTGVLLQISDPNGNTLTFTYSGGSLTQVSNNFGNSITLQYSGGRISSITDPKGQSVTYSYAGADLMGANYPDSRSLGYAYSNHNMTDKYDSSNYQIGHWDYDANGRVSNYYRYVDNGVAQEQVGFTYNLASTNGPVTLTRSTGDTNYHTTISKSHRMITDIDNCSTCGGIAKRFTYTSNLDLASVTIISEGQAYTTQYTYDNPSSSWLQIGEVTAIKEAAGLTGERTTSYTYAHRSDDPFLLTQSTESKKSVVNPSQNKVTTTVYDAYGNIASRSVSGYNGSGAATTAATTYQYSSAGQVTRIDGPRTDVPDITTFTYYPNVSAQGNNRGRLATTTNALSQTTTFGNYDGNGNVGTITDPNGVVTIRTYDQRNRILTVTNQATNAVTQYSYDSHGNFGSVAYPEGNSITFTYSLGDRLIQITDNLGNRIQYTYDDQGNRISQVIFDPQGTLKTSLSYTYDTYNRLSAIMNPDSTLTAYSYDGRGNVTGITDPRNHTTTYTYDALGRKTTLNQPYYTTGYGYDTQDNTTLITDPNGNSTTYAFDDMGNRYRTISPDTGTKTQSYDAAGNLIYTTDANGNTITYVYDALNRLVATQFADSSQNITNTYDSTVVTYGLGRLTGRTDPSGTYVFNYDAQGNMVREDRTIGGVVYTTQYVYNKNNVLTSIVYPTGRTVTYSLDSEGKVNQVSAVVNGSTKALASSISYLPFGGISSFVYGNNLSLTQTYDDRYRVSSIIAGSVLYRTYAYDANGNITSILDSVDSDVPPLDPLSTYIYENGSNILTEITGTASTIFTSDPNGNTIAENTRTYAYDSLNQLTGVWDGSTQIAQYAFNGIGQRIKKVTAAGTKIFHYDSSGHIIAETDGAGQMLAEYIYLGDQLFAMIRPGEAVYYYHNDHLGTPQVLTDANGNIAWKAAYAPFGKVQISVSTIENNFRFPGQYYDGETGLAHNGFRYYKAEIGRYVTADPIGLYGGINPFAYAAGSPISNSDPEGLQAVIPVPQPIPPPGVPVKPVKIPQEVIDILNYFNPVTACEGAKQMAKDLCKFYSDWRKDVDFDNWRLKDLFEPAPPDPEKNKKDEKNRHIERCHEKCEGALDQPGVEGRCNQGTPYTNCMKQCMALYGFNYP